MVTHAYIERINKEAKAKFPPGTRIVFRSGVAEFPTRYGTVIEVHNLGIAHRGPLLKIRWDDGTVDSSWMLNGVEPLVEGADNG